MRKNGREIYQHLRERTQRYLKFKETCRSQDTTDATSLPRSEDSNIKSHRIWWLAASQAEKPQPLPAVCTRAVRIPIPSYHEDSWPLSISIPSLPLFRRTLYFKRLVATICKYLSTSGDLSHLSQVVQEEKKLSVQHVPEIYIRNCVKICLMTRDHRRRQEMPQWGTRMGPLLTEIKRRRNGLVEGRRQQVRNALERGSEWVNSMYLSVCVWEEKGMHPMSESYRVNFMLDICIVVHTYKEERERERGRAYILWSCGLICYHFHCWQWADLDQLGQ